MGIQRLQFPGYPVVLPKKESVNSRQSQVFIGPSISCKVKPSHILFGFSNSNKQTKTNILNISERKLENVIFQDILLCGFLQLECGIPTVVREFGRNMLNVGCERRHWSQDVHGVGIYGTYNCATEITFLFYIHLSSSGFPEFQESLFLFFLKMLEM